MVRNRFLEIRLRLGYRKQKEFAEFIGVTQALYNKYENNTSQPGLDTLLKISKKLDIKIDDIVYLEDSN